MARLMWRLAAIVAGSTLAVAAGCGQINSFPATAPMPNQVAYVSLQGDGRVAVYDLDVHTGQWTLAQEVAIRDGEVAWATSAPIAISPDGGTLHVGLRGEGSVATYAIGPRGRLSPLGTTGIGGSAPYLWRDPSGRWLLAPYYPEGKVSVHRIGANGEPIEGPAQEIPTAPNAHSILADPSNRFVFVPHTGPNTIYQFRFDATTGRLTPGEPPSIEPEPSRGPRHALFHPALPVAYVINESASTVTAYRFDDQAGTITPFQELSTLPPDYTGNNSTADLHLTPDGRFLYGSNRGHNSIAAYRVDPTTGDLELIADFETEATPRSFAIDLTGRFLYVAGQGSGRVAAYRIDPETGELLRFDTYDVGPQPTWIELLAVE